MQTRKKITLLAMVLALTIGMAGCGDGGGDNTPAAGGGGSIAVNDSTPISDIQASVANMDTETLRTAALDWKAEIDAKFAEFTELTKQYTAKAAEGLLNAEVKLEAEALKVDMDEIQKSVAALTERFQVIFAKLQEAGGDVSGLELPKIL